MAWGQPYFPGGSGPTTGEGPSRVADRDDFAAETDGVDIEEEIDFDREIRGD